jgi:putative colanic acid biosynthesis UDP-glucose lipid carrier transferase
MKIHDYSKIYIKTGVAVGELIILNMLLVLLLHIYPYAVTSFPSNWVIADRERMFFAVSNMAYLLSLSWTGIVLDERMVFIERVLERVFKLVAFHFAITFSALYFTKIHVAVSFLLIFSCSLFFAFACWRIIARAMVKNYRSHGGNSRRVIILGAGSVANEVYSQLVTNISYGYKFLGFFDDRAVADYKVKPELVVGKLDAVNDFIENNDVEEIYCALPAGDDRKAVPIIHFAEQNLVRCFLIPDFKRFIRKKVSLSFMEEIPVISMRTEPLLKFGNQVEKRIFDLVVSTIFLITIFPLLLIFLGLGIKLTSKGPIFFKQKRTGENGTDFYCYKFRTMCVNQDADSKQATKDDSRVTKIGAFMRKTNLDEMPQFFNVFIGNMSIVGPRPHMLKHTEMYSKLIDQYMIRHFAKPGITGWAQVTGFRGETQRLEEMEGRVKRDVWYIENWSFFLDVRIIFMTVFNMFRGDKNAY